MEKPLTKTDFILYRECSHNVWVKWHKSEEYNKFEVSEFEKSLGVMGNEVELEARKLFPDGVLIEGRNIKYQEQTKKLISERTPVIFQAVFATDKYLAATDILKWNSEANAYDLYEVKMSSVDEDDDEVEEGKPRKVNKKKELQFEYDLSFQVNVLKLCDVNINKKYLLRLNKDYIRVGKLNLERLFETTDKTEIVDGVFEDLTLTEMESAFERLSREREPQGPCGCYYKGRSSHCTTFSLCNPDVPNYSVHDLNRIGNSKKYLQELLDEGILRVEDVPEDDRLKPKKPKMGEEPSKPKKLNQVKVHKSKNPIVDIEAIRSELDSLTFPLYFLDYETYPTAIPPFDGYHPYQHIVFQYSLHILRSKDGELEHKDCLILEGDPAKRLVESMREHIGDTGSVISWYKHFENSRNRELAKLLPEYSDFLHRVINRTYDLMDIVDHQHYVHHGFKGSASIKKVQQVLAPDFSYKDLDVQSGTDAIEAYRQIYKGELVGEEVEEKKKQMLLYCKNDTEVMVVIWKFFVSLIKNHE